MTKVISSQQPEYIVYMLSEKEKKIITGISEKESFLTADPAARPLKLIYYEIFNDRSKAIRRKNQLNKLSGPERIKLIKRKNPELLNLIFSIKDNYSIINF